MPAGIEQDDEMMYIGEAPWHKLGVKLDNIATAREAIEAAQLNWEVQTEPIMTVGGKMIPKRMATVRSDTGTPLGVVSDRYQVVQNKTAFDFFDEVTLDPNGPKYVTAGSLHGGRRIWLLAKLPDFIQVTNSDIVEEYLLFTNSHDGSRMVTMAWTPIRVVCWNTLTYALTDIEKRETGVFRNRHVGSIMSKIRNAQDALGIIQENRTILTEAFDQMLNYNPSHAEVEYVMQKLFAGEADEELSTRAKNIIEEITGLYHSGKGNEADGVRGTAWALYNGFTEYADHYRTTRGDNPEESRLEASWFGSGAELKVAAFGEIMKLCGEHA